MLAFASYTPYDNLCTICSLAARELTVTHARRLLQLESQPSILAVIRLPLLPNLVTVQIRFARLRCIWKTLGAPNFQSALR